MGWIWPFHLVENQMRMTDNALQTALNHFSSIQVEGT